MLNLKSKSKIFISSKCFLFLIIILGFILRVYGINWDKGFHFHPDERMLIMVAGRLHFFNQLNPDFFNYGSLPVYLLRGTTQFIDFIFNSHWSGYDGALYVGRILSTIFDLMTILIIYKIAETLFKNKTIALLSSFFYTIAFFPIQNSHFFVVDVYLTTFTTLLIFLLLNFMKGPSFQRPYKDGRNNYLMYFLIGVVVAAMMTTKFTAIVFYPVIIFIFIIKKITNKQLTIKQLIIEFLIFNFSLVIFSFFFMPYAFIEYKRFISDILAQIKMNSDPYIFPYTLQYVGTTPYLYYLKNIFLWGLGPVVSTLSLVGLTLFIVNLKEKLTLTLKYQISNFKNQKYTANIKKKEYLKFNMYILYLLFYLLYFLIIGRSAVKFMRYMLPIYPFLVILAGVGLYQISKIKYQKYKLNFGHVLFLGLLTLQCLWTLMFMNIYRQPHTRIAATDWILNNIPIGSTLAVEHWDDRVPIYGGEKYNYVEMTLYERPDDDLKWQGLNEKLKQADYIILASNRLYVPLQKLNDCNKYKSCYPKTTEYYHKLFNGELGFIKVAEFAVYPKFNVGRLMFNINDQSADESFTVYDHPKVMVFKRNG